MNLDKGKKTILGLFAILSAVVVIIGGSYAFFSFSQEGTTENTISAGSVKFHYDEKTHRGAGIALADSLPIDDNKDGVKSNDYFEFDITAKSANQPINYVITAKLDGNSDAIMGDIVDLLLTSTWAYNNGSNTLEYYRAFDRYNNFIQYRNKAATERVIYTATVYPNSSDYEENYRLRMWIDQNVELSGQETTKYFCSGTEVELNSEAYNNCDAANLTQTTEIEYPYENKTFKLTINVYTDTDITGYEPTTTTYNNTSISNLQVEGCTLDKQFSPDEHIYACNSDMTPTSKLQYTYTLSNPNATVVEGDMYYNNGLSYGGFGTIPSAVDIESGVMEHRTTVFYIIAEDGISANAFAIDHPSYADPYLNSLSINGCDISFNKFTLSYSCNTANTLTTSDFTYTTNYNNYPVTVTQPESNKFVVAVSTPDNGITNSYTIIVNND